MKHQLHIGNCLELMPWLDHYTCIFADPPDNIGLGYDDYDDSMATDEYRGFLCELVNTCTNLADTVWFSFNAKWTFVMGMRFAYFLDNNPDWEGKACQQVFTFGQHNSHDLGNNHRPLWRLKKKSAPLYPDAIKVPSWRERNGDKRAKPGGRVPGDVFDMQEREWSEMVADVLGTRDDFWPGDVFDFPRVTGNSKQRCDWHPTQLHEDLVERCIKLSTQEGDTVLDPFGGTGTTLRVCNRLKRPCTLIEMDAGYCDRIARANDLKWSAFGRYES